MSKILVGDFETTVYKGQTSTEVWASALVEMWTEDVIIFGSIKDTLDYIALLNDDLTIYYHNLAFDGSFWLSYLIQEANFIDSYNPNKKKFKKKRYLEERELTYMISDMGQFYSITFKLNNHIIELRDSLKLLPFTVRSMGKSFKTKHQKLEMEYSGYRYANCYISPQEKEYIANDVLVVKECLEIMFKDGHDKLTIGSCCINEYKTILGKQLYEELFPDLEKYNLFFDSEYTDEPQAYRKYHTITNIGYKYENAERYIRKSYKGGWCYVVKGCENIEYSNGCTCDVNSLYPSVMHSDSGNEYPVGQPRFWKGNFIPTQATKPHTYFFIRIRTRFHIKKGKLPFIQVKDSFLYKPNEYLESSDATDFLTGETLSEFEDSEGNIEPIKVLLTLTQTDYYLMLDHYDLYDCEILDGCYFQTEIGIFDNYINKYAEIKKNSTGAKRAEAKLFLNNLYGKLATSNNSSFKHVIFNDEGIMKFETILENQKKTGYIAIGSAITSYARYFTITHAQKNYHVNPKTGKPWDDNGNHINGFIYADTDSIHCDIHPSKLIDIRVHNTNFNSWKIEACWDRAIFVRQKTYIEHITHEDLEQISKSYFNVKACGMGKRCQQLISESLSNNDINTSEYTKEELEFINNKMDLTDFKIGLQVPSDLSAKRIKGGVLLVEGIFTMR